MLRTSGVPEELDILGFVVPGQKNPSVQGARMLGTFGVPEKLDILGFEVPGQ